jgi:hypothetical protein
LPPVAVGSRGCREVTAVVCGEAGQVDGLRKVDGERVGMVEAAAGGGWDSLPIVSTRPVNIVSLPVQVVVIAVGLWGEQ